MVSAKEYLEEYGIEYTENIFCNSCGSLLSRDTDLEKKVKENIEDLGEDIDESFFNCGNCDSEYFSGDMEVLETKMKPKNKRRVIEEDVRSSVDMKCPDCGNNEAYMNEFPPLFGDEDNIVLYECSSCGNTFRENSMKIK